MQMTKQDRIRETKRDYMRRVRSDPAKRELINAKRRGNKAYRKREKEYRAKICKAHFFVWRSRLWLMRFGVVIPPKQLFSLWHRQQGLCALSGRKLNEEAHLDHITPIVKGGLHTIDNLRWLSPEINLAKRALSDNEFCEMCKDVVEWIGRRIVKCKRPT